MARDVVAAPGERTRRVGSARSRRRGAQAEAEAPSLERPPLGEIFRDGRYDFQPAPKVEQVFENFLEKDPAAAEGIDRVVARHVFSRGELRSRTVAITFVLTEKAVEEPACWEGFLRGASETAGEDLERAEMDGVPVAYSETDAEHGVTIYYAKDLVVTVAAPPPIPRSELDDNRAVPARRALEPAPPHDVGVAASRSRSAG